MKLPILKSALFAFLFLVINSCREQIVPTEVELSEYGWDMYTEGNYEEAIIWFGEAIFEDSTYKDGFNGLLWAYGKTGELSKSLDNADEGMILSDDINLVGTGHPTGTELLAGLALIQHARENYSDAVMMGDSLLSAVGDDDYVITSGVTSWQFSRDATIDSKDIIWTLASSQFVLGQFDSSLTRIKQLLFLPDDFNPVVSTVEGRSELAAQIEAVRSTI
jgi:tetratricopeptide (TPR) repeat protein|tara:strand:- start:584 stop:1243 length:660 start_codon:yes stop_codon:yes gene_type:complete